MLSVKIREKCYIRVVNVISNQAITPALVDKSASELVRSLKDFIFGTQCPKWLNFACFTNILMTDVPLTLYER